MSELNDIKILVNPPQNLINFYIERTRKHIKLVIDEGIKLKNNYSKLPKEISYKLCNINTNDYYQRFIQHDLSKFSGNEFYPYIWMTWYYKCKNEGSNFKYPNMVIQTAVESAVYAHYGANSHHYHYRDYMSFLDIVEMVADIRAMSIEFNDDSSIYFKNKIFNDKQFKATKFDVNNIEEVILELCSI